MNGATRRGFIGTLAACPWLARAAAGAGIAADFDPVGTLWLSHASGHEALTRGLVLALQSHAKLRFLVADEPSAARVQALWPGLEPLVEPRAGFFLRDLLVFTRDGGVIDFHATQDGAPAWCARRYRQSPERAACVAHAESVAAEQVGVGRSIADRLEWPVLDTPLAMEGGGIESNGRGLLIANEALWRSRNPRLGRAQIERELLRLPGVRKLIWLPEGLAEDVHLRGTITGDHVAWGAGGHTDEFVRFADERTVLLAWPDASDGHPVSRISAARMARNAAILAAATDQRGRRLRVIKVPMPRIVQRRVVIEADADPARSEQWRADYFAPQEGRREGDALWQVATATYLNFVVANGMVVLPDYRPHGTPLGLQERARAAVASAFPGREIEFVDPITANWVGGGLHCATLNQP